MSEDNSTKYIGSGLDEEKIDDLYKTDKIKYCPLLLGLQFVNPKNCVKETCAWYDDKNNQCSIITIGRK